MRSSKLFTLEPEVAAKLDGVDNASALVNRLLIAHFEMTEELTVEDIERKRIQLKEKEANLEWQKRRAIEREEKKQKDIELTLTAQRKEEERTISTKEKRRQERKDYEQYLKDNPNIDFREYGIEDYLQEKLFKA